ncbi:MAG: TadE/TadG family type IV pilus assembly protein [Kiritimatiellia bacterium]|jgi:hypothetical protein
MAKASAASRKTARSTRPDSRRCGQAMIESLLAILLICLLFFGLFQLAHASASREILRHAAARAARARAVGFNGWMVRKSMRVAAIPNAGAMTVPAGESFAGAAFRNAVASGNPGAVWDLALQSHPHSERGDFELARLGDYLDSPNEPTADQILDYENWDDIRGSGLGGGGFAPLVLSRMDEVAVEQSYPLHLHVKALLDLFGTAGRSPLDEGRLRLRGRQEIESHYPLYLEDHGW